ncbi:MAG: RNA-binding transcriptional accessory protein [Acholeplasmataceae bacterium]|jgi:uncharacterized protein|nr:RNA-binding transcriptional accessory protein [Acholeplasmataceae bacterium]
MDNKLVIEVAKNLEVKIGQVEQVLALLNEGNTIPFIARYRKEITGGLDEEQIKDIHREWSYSVNLQKRKEDVIRLIDEKEMLTDELLNQINEATKLVDVEDLYRPYKEKKKTKATEAIKLGLEPLAEWILTFPEEGDLNAEAEKYITEEVKTTKEAIEGAGFIIAERISDNADYRKALREEMFKEGFITSKARKGAAENDPRGIFQQYYDYEEGIAAIAHHRVLAINRAESLKLVNVSIEADRDKIQEFLEAKVIIKESIVNSNIRIFIADSIRRLIYPSLEREIRSNLTEQAEEDAIDIFAINLKNLLLQPPMKDKIVLGVDPAFRTGCKLTVVNEQGTVLAKDVIYPHEKYIGEKGYEVRIPQSEKIVLQLIAKHNVDIVAIGNGTASRETEAFIAKLIKENKLPTKYVIVDESGASVYSASELARKEFPDYSVEERSAVSIARRLQDPLSELVKIDPKSIGVGQYQHDVSQKKLSETLDFVVSNAVNQVGVNVNTASESLLNYVSGLDRTMAKNIVKYREKHGNFVNREQLLNVPRIGEKSFEQAAGFLRIIDGNEGLDMTSIHPESYEVARQIMKNYNIAPNIFGKNEVKLIVEFMDRARLRSDLNIDVYTLNDILDAFVQPLRDPRDEFSAPQLRSDILNLEDLKPGMQLEGTVRNVVAFGAFVDCGLEEDGLVHISKMSTRFVRNPNDIVQVGDIIKVWVLDVDTKRRKVSLSMVPPRKNN